MNETPSSERLQIGFFGCRNAGKSSLFNAVASQQLAVVSNIKGTTTDPVNKSMEIPPLGPVTLIDTPGLDDDSGELGTKRVYQAYRILRRCDLVLLVCDASTGMNQHDISFYKQIQAQGILCLIVYNKTDLIDKNNKNTDADGSVDNPIMVSALQEKGIEQLKKEIIRHLESQIQKLPIVSDLLPAGGTAVLVVPIDKAAPKGRLILPQQQTIRDLLDHGCISTVVRDTELAAVLTHTIPNIVITDSQIFQTVAKVVPEAIPLTSFSILLARYKGVLHNLVSGAYILDDLRDGDHILIAEGCTHHRQCEDIGTVKLPTWIQEYSSKQLYFDFCSGTEFPEMLSQFRLIIHCGGCMLNAKEMQYRQRSAAATGIPMTNYGTAIAHMHGILTRSLKPLGIFIDDFRNTTTVQTQS